MSVEGRENIARRGLQSTVLPGERSLAQRATRAVVRSLSKNRVSRLAASRSRFFFSSLMKFGVSVKMSLTKQTARRYRRRVVER